MVGLERSLEVIPLAPPGGVTGPAKSDYRRLLRKPYTARIEPTYVSGKLVPPEVHAAVGLDQFRARHLRPILRCTGEELCAIVLWRVAIMPSLVVTIDSVRVVLCKARKSTLFRDLVEYCMIEWLREEELQWVVEFLQNVSMGVPLRALVHGDFYALLAKVPHGPIVNARPLSNFTTMRKLVGAHIASQYVPLLARAGVLPCTHFALHASSSVVDLLRVLHAYIWFCFLRRKRVCLVVDDVRHVYGSVVHDTLRCLLRLAGFLEVVIDLLLLATTEATVHMGGSGGVTEALARLLAGVAQGCPASVVVLCVVAEVRPFLALLRVPPCWGPGGPFNRLDIYGCTSVYMGGLRMPVHQGPWCVRIVGRHLFPHVYHRVDKVKLFSASRRASRALAMVRLPSSYPTILDVKCSRRWTAKLASRSTPFDIQLHAGG